MFNSNKIKDIVTYSLMGLLGIVYVVMPNEAYAGLNFNLCPLVEILTGPVAQAVATVGVVVIGMGALIGRVQWTQVILVAVGVAVIFGAPGLIAAVDGASSCANGAPV